MAENQRNYFFWNRHFFEEAMGKNLCPHCEHFREDGICGNPDARGCAVFRYLPELVRIAQHQEGFDLPRYREEVRQQVPMDCGNLNRNGPCQLQDTLECGLERYLPFIMEAVREEDSVLEHRKGFET